MTQEELGDHVIEALHATSDGYRRLIRDLVERDGHLAVSDVAIALHGAATRMDATVRRAGASTVEARMARRLAALLARDATATGHWAAGGSTMAEAGRRWVEGDDFLLRL